MKLLKASSRLREVAGGNVKTQAALGDAQAFGFSDGGSIPPASTFRKALNINIFWAFSVSFVWHLTTYLTTTSFFLS